MQKIKRETWRISIAILAVIFIFSSCKKYLDIIPDNVPTIDNAFTMRAEAEKYLYTCYSYMPKDGNLASDPAILSGDEIWAINQPPKPAFSHTMFSLAMGLQTTISPIGDNQWINLYKGIRDCNIFLENIGKVPDLYSEERKQWIAEAKFLKAYYHFYLVRMYGPIPVVKDNLPVDVDISSVKIFRSPVDSCFSYIVQLLDEAKDDLQPFITDPVKMLGRITQPIAYSLKAKVLVTAASPLFNGNTEQATLKNSDGTVLFNQQVVAAKWDSAASACKRAIEISLLAGNKLYKFNPTAVAYALSDTMKTQLTLRNMFTERWNSDIIWANTQSVANSIQLMATPNVNFTYQDNPNIAYELAPPLKIVDMFYTKNGVPTSEDRFWTGDATTRRVGTPADAHYIKQGYETSTINYDREPRFYANLGFDGGIWYGQGSYDDSKPNGLYYVSAKKTQPNGRGKPDYGSVTGYFIKKYVHYQNTQGSGVADYSVTTYPWPLIRLSQLYLLYAEALNEASGPVNDVHQYIDFVRDRAGLKSVKFSWDNYSNNPGKYTTKTGMREIIHREQLIELAFEGARFWDLRRWKEAPREYTKLIQGWDIEQSSANLYYRETVLFTPHFSIKDYFWPIKDGTILNNKNLVQNIGW